MTARRGRSERIATDVPVEGDGVEAVAAAVVAARAWADAERARLRAAGATAGGLRVRIIDTPGTRRVTATLGVRFPAGHDA